MQKIQSYLYPNRTILIADLAGQLTENTIVYARTIKIYQGVDNVIQFDIQNADQKRLDLTTLTNLQMNVFDQSNKALPTSPYAITVYTGATTTASAQVIQPIPVRPASSTTIVVPTANITGKFVLSQQITGTAIVGTVSISNITSNVDAGTTTLTVTFPMQTVTGQTNIAISSILNGLSQVVIPAADLIDYENQTFQYSVTATDAMGHHITLYTDSRFSAVGKMELVQTAVPKIRKNKIYDRFSGEINYLGNVINHSSVISTKYYEASPTTTITFMVDMTNFIGQIYIEGTKDSTISVQSFTNATKIQSHTYNTATTTTLTFTDVPVSDFNNLRVSWTYPDVWQYGSQQNPLLPFGTVDKITVYYGEINC
jgi:hypothetical protein